MFENEHTMSIEPILPSGHIPFDVRRQILPLLMHVDAQQLPSDNPLQDILLLGLHQLRNVELEDELVAIVLLLQQHVVDLVGVFELVQNSFQMRLGLRQRLLQQRPQPIFVFQQLFVFLRFHSIILNAVSLIPFLFFA